MRKFKSIKEDQFKRLKDKTINCKKCPLYRTRKNVVFGEGPLNAKIMVIGEAPGRNEDLTGRPFCGRSGNLLTELLNTAGLKREEIFITSVIKCRPTKNRNPTKEEIAACKPILLKQIDIIKPKLIVTLGLIATNIFLNKVKMVNVHGKIVKTFDFNIIPTYHPAAALRFPKFKEIIIKDLESTKNI